MRTDSEFPLSPIPEGIRIELDASGVDWEHLKRTLASDDFDNGRTPQQYQMAFENSWLVGFAWAGQRVVGKARLISDGVGCGYLVDVWTHSEFRRRGIASAMLSRMLARCHGQHIVLFTSGMESFYSKLGFISCNGTMERVVGRWLG